MITKLYKQLHDITTIYTQPPGRKNVMLQLGVSATWYFNDLHLCERKKNFLRVFDEYCQIFSDKIKWTCNPDTGAWKKLRNINSYIHPSEWILDISEKQSFYFFYHGGEHGWDASNIQFKVFGEGFWPEGQSMEDKRHLSAVYCVFPLDFLKLETKYFPDLFIKWNSILQPFHGRAGLSFAKSASHHSSPESQLAEADLLMSFPGLNFFEVGEYHWMGDGLYDGLRSADWMVFLSTSFLDALGGLDEIEKVMKPLPVHRYDNGAILQAGEYPELGIRGDHLSNYEHLATVIEPIRARNLTARIRARVEGKGVVGSSELMEKWCTRFNPGSNY